MAEDQDNSVGENSERERESKGLLASNLFSNAFADNARELLKKAEADLARGATEQANEHLRKVGLASAHALTNMTSTRLSDQENEIWLGLQHRKFSVEKSGFISERSLDEGSEALLRRLERKAFGQDQDK